MENWKLMINIDYGKQRIQRLEDVINPETSGGGVYMLIFLKII